MYHEGRRETRHEQQGIELCQKETGKYSMSNKYCSSIKCERRKCSLSINKSSYITRKQVQSQQ